MEERMLIDRKTVAVLLGVTSRTVGDWVSRGIFPRPKVMTQRTMWWSRKVVDDWINSEQISSVAAIEENIDRE